MNEKKDLTKKKDESGQMVINQKDGDAEVERPSFEERYMEDQEEYLLIHHLSKAINHKFHKKKWRVGKYSKKLTEKVDEI